MGDDFNKNLGITAGVGCATGFLWSALSGKADISTAKGFARALIGCGGSAFNGASIYTASNYLFDDKTARRVTTAWFGFQSASSFTQTLGNRYGWHDSTAYNLVAFPLNFGAAPLSSSVGILWGLTGEASAGSRSGIELFGGTLAFKHDCGHNIQLGATKQSCPGYDDLETKFHELGHQAQFSIMGDFGMAGLNLLNGAGRLIIKQDLNDREFIIEKWADDYSETVMGSFDGPRFVPIRIKLEGSYQGIPIDTSENIGVYHGDKIASADIAADYKIGSTLIPKGSRVFFDSLGNLVSFGLTDELLIQDKPFQKVGFYKNGKIKFGILSRDFSWNDTEYRAGSRFNFGEDGHVESIYLSAIHTIQGYPCDQEKIAEFYPSGHIKKCILPPDATVHGIPGKEGSEVEVYENGQMKLIRLSEDTEIPVTDTAKQKIPVAKNTWVAFHSNGNIKEAILSSDYPLRGVKYPKGSKVVFNKFGKLLWVVKPKD